MVHEVVFFWLDEAIESVINLPQMGAVVQIWNNKNILNLICENFKENSSKIS